MVVRKRVLARLHRTLLYWGLLNHPFGQDYVQEHYSPTGKQTTTIEETEVEIPVVDAVDPDS